MNAYEQLQAVLDTHPSRAPKTDSFMEILGILFTPDEAALAATMNFKAKDLDKIAKAADLDETTTQRLLDSMVSKAIIHYTEKDGKKKYGLVPTIPGLFEFPFMKGGGTPMHDRLGKLWEQYHHEALGNAFAGNPTPLMRVVPVEQSLSPKNRVHPYEEVRSFIMNAEFIAVTNCACRVSVGACGQAEGRVPHLRRGGPLPGRDRQCPADQPGRGPCRPRPRRGSGARTYQQQQLGQGRPHLQLLPLLLHGAQGQDPAEAPARVRAEPVRGARRRRLLHRMRDLRRRAVPGQGHHHGRRRREGRCRELHRVRALRVRVPRAGH